MASGKPTIRSQWYKKQQLLLRDAKIQGNYALPPPLADFASDSSPSSRAFSTLHALVEAACLAASVTGPSMEHILKTALGWIVDCSHRFHEAQTELSILRQLLSDANKQNEILKCELAETNIKLSQSLLKEDFYREQALKMNLVPPHRRLRSIAPAAESALNPEQRYQPVLHHLDALASRDHDIQRLQLLQTDLDRLIEASTDQLADRVRALEQHVALCTALHAAKRPRTPIAASDDDDELFPSAGRILERYKASLALERYHATVASLHDRLESLASPRPPRLNPREPSTPRGDPSTPRAGTFTPQTDPSTPRAGPYTPRAGPYTPRAGPCVLRLDGYTPRGAGAAPAGGASPPRSARARALPLTADQIVAAAAAAADAVPSPSWAAFAPVEPAVSNPRLRRRLDPGNPLW